MKYSILIVLAAVTLAVYSDANTPKGTDLQAVLAAGSAPKIVDDGCAVTVTVPKRSRETWDALLARAAAAGARWQRENPDKANRACISIVSRNEKPGQESVTWSTYYAP